MWLAGPAGPVSKPTSPVIYTASPAVSCPVAFFTATVADGRVIFVILVFTVLNAVPPRISVWSAVTIWAVIEESLTVFVIIEECVHSFSSFSSLSLRV